MTIFLGGDLASSSGLCYGRPDTTPVVQALRAPVTGDDYGLWGAYWFRALSTVVRQLAARLEPSERIIANIEAPLLPRERFDKKTGKMVGQTNIQTTRKLHSLGVLFETVATILSEDEGIPIDVYECNLKTLKAELAGHGGASKSDMVFVARRAGIVLPEGKEAEDCADSFAAWYMAMRIHAPEFLPMWDRRLFSPGRRFL